jgi:superfamily II DNA or RNA helicase
MASFRPYQQQAFDAIVNELQNNNKCIVKMFCGSGKSLIMHNIVKHFDLQLSVFVFPSLSLVDQFYTDYLKKSSSILKISSDAESTTEIDVITKFINNKKNTKKIICITYQSFNLLLNNLQGNKIDVCCFDEAHHAIGNTYQKLIFNDDDTISKQIFFTATPKNANGIVMYDRNDLSKSMCGNLVYDYSYLQGVNEGFLNPFEIRVDLFTENTNKSIYESIARAILTTGNSRVLTFHSSVNSESDSSIINFVDEKAFKLAFNHVVKTEFPTKKGFYKKICMIGLDAKTIMVNRREILKKFKKGTNDDTEHNITVLCSCETIGEGVDTNDANMCVFVDPKSSVVKIIQNIGRIVRKQFGVEKPNSTILIPCWVDKSKYEECNGVKEDCDKVIREDMNSDGNFSGIMNVLSALQQEQPDVYDMCLNYSNTYSYYEIEANFTKQGYKMMWLVMED